MDGLESLEWAKSEFSKAELGHADRNARAVSVAARMVQAPNLSIPRFCVDEKEIKAAYEFFANEAFGHDELLSGHVRKTAERCSGLGEILVVQDTMSASFGGTRNRKGLGPVNDSAKAQGFLTHSALAISLQGATLGLLGQLVWSRPSGPKPRYETAEQRRQRPRESQHWYQVQEQVARSLREFAAEVPRVIGVFDREGDVFEVFDRLDALGHGFVIRATQNRLLVGDDPETPSYGLDEVRKAPVITELSVEVPARPGQTKRTAKLEVRAVSVEVRPPKSAGRKGAPQRMNIVLVDEVQPPSKKQALCWYLLTTEPIATVQDVLRVVDIYKLRWRIEELHMGLKTGCSLESRQLEQAHNLQSFLAMASVVAVKLLQLRDLSRASEPVPATEVLNPVQIALLREVQPKLKADCTAAEALRVVAQLGGFVGTNKGARPGWRSLWWGYMRLLEQENGYRLAMATLAHSN